ncbi:hypothetical protein MKW98_010836 [Papaver atlanticum]|uniref:RED-like N-terminal domain-containing protein n=1 Tax=Papaver atlanticum TaxID=357466 RepID=A0AAD4SM11_9MAGN|nr:hypothetical protein MKW98_010836 [Papaver atlanticum]
MSSSKKNHYKEKMMNRKSDVEHTHLAKGLDYALLNKVRSEIKKPEAGEETDGKTSKVAKEEHAVSFRTATAKSVYQWIVKPQTTVKLNEMFLPGRMSFIFNMVPNSGSWNYNINGVKHNTNLMCGIKLGSMVTLRISARLVGYLLSRKGLNLLRNGSPLGL